MNKIPTLSVDLIKYLDEQFPLRLPNSINFTPQEVAYIMGQRSVLEHLNHLIKKDDDEGGMENVL